jgi:hypothetical protein
MPKDSLRSPMLQLPEHRLSCDFIIRPLPPQANNIDTYLHVKPASVRPSRFCKPRPAMARVAACNQAVAWLSGFSQDRLMLAAKPGTTHGLTGTAAASTRCYATSPYPLPLCTVPEWNWRPRVGAAARRSCGNSRASALPGPSVGGAVWPLSY